MHLSHMPLAQTKRFTSSLLRQKVAKLAECIDSRRWHDSLPDVLPCEIQVRFVIADTPKGDMDMRVLGIEMRHRDPLQAGAEVLLHPRNEIARRFQVDPVAEFG